MAQSPILVGTLPNDGTGDAIRTAFQKVNANTAELYLEAPIWASTVIAANYSGATYEAKLTAAIADAAATGKRYCWVNQPYTASLVTRSASVKLIAEGHSARDFNVLAYGAKGDGVADDTVAIQAAITACNTFVSTLTGNALVGGVVYFPPGKYVVSSTLQVPVVTNASIVLRGGGMRTTYLYFSGPSTNYTASPLYNTCLLFGASAPDAAGVFTNQTQYCGMEDLSISGSLTTTGSFVGVQFTEMQFGWLRNVIIESFPNASIGLYLRGSTVTGGLGTQNTSQHVRLCTFQNVVIASIGSANGASRACVLQNADENDFYNCSFACSQGQSGAGADTLFSFWIQMGRNNRLFGCLYNGDDANLTPNVGLVFGPPQNEAAVANGSVLMNQDYGCVAEGFDRCVWFRQDTSNNLRGNMVYGFNPAVFNTAYLDDNASNGRGNLVFAPLQSPVINYLDGPTHNGSAQTITGASPDVGNGNVFACGNGGATNLATFTNHALGQLIWVRLDANTTVIDAQQAGGNNIRCWGRVNIPPGADTWIGFVRVGSTSYQITPVLRDTVAGDLVATPEATLVAGITASAGNLFQTTVTAARLVGLPLQGRSGQRITFSIIQGGAGGFAVTWNAAFKQAWSDTGNTTGKRSTISFIYDGTNWNQDGAQSPYI